MKRAWLAFLILTLFLLASCTDDLINGTYSNLYYFDKIPPVK